MSGGVGELRINSRVEQVEHVEEEELRVKKWRSGGVVSGGVKNRKGWN